MPLKELIAKILYLLDFNAFSILQQRELLPQLRAKLDDALLDLDKDGLPDELVVLVTKDADSTNVRTNPNA